MAASHEMLRLEVATPVGLALRTEANSIEAPSVNGEFGVFPGHRPLLAALKAGLLKYHVEGKDQVAAIGHGFVEAEPDRVLVLTDQFALPKDIDEAAVKRELEEADTKLKAFPSLYEGPDYEVLQRAVDWAHARLEAIAFANK